MMHETTTPEQMLDFDLKVMEVARIDFAAATIRNTASEFPTVPFYLLIEWAAEDYGVDVAELSREIRKSDRKMLCG
jgi:hypothetical protein